MWAVQQRGRVDMSVFIIAEAGVNHNGDIRIAKRLIDQAKKSGADAVKFQTFIADKMISVHAPKAEYQKKTTHQKDSHLEIVKNLELNEKAHRELLVHCKKKKILFLSSPFEVESINLLKRLGLGMLKIPSGEITNPVYLEEIGKLNKKLILSTGMSDLNEIKQALDILTRAGTAKKHITVLHCNTEYPTPFEDVNLRAMLTIQKECGVDVGYSDHTSGIVVAVAAVALGACMIEKHLTLDRAMAGPDHKASLEPGEFASMVDAIRNIEKSMGSPVKRPSPSEKKNIVIARKSIVASREILQGEQLTLENVEFKRPGSGLSPMKWSKLKGKKAKRNFCKDELIEL